MRISLGTLVLMVALSAGALPAFAAEDAVAIPPQITTPDSVDTSLGTLKFDDGIPSGETAQKAYDQLDLQRGVEAFLNGLRGVSIYAARKGIRDAGAKDNEGVLIFSGLMDANSCSLPRTPTRSISSPTSISPRGPWWWRRRRTRSACSTICGSAG